MVVEPMPANVSQLIEQACGADSGALDQLLSVYRNYLRVTAQVWLPDRLPSKLDASDLVQETLLKAHQRFDQFRGSSETELTIWLRRILSRCLVDFVRYHQSSRRNVAREFSASQMAASSADILGSLASASGTSQRARGTPRAVSATGG